MSPEAQRVAIAEWFGIEDVKKREVLRGRVLKSALFGKVDGRLVECPDYLNDLNAIHEAEKSITDAEWVGYEEHLIELVVSTADNVFKMVHATATQRCEALLKTIGKWEESK